MPLASRSAPLAAYLQPSALASLTLSFHDAVVSILCRSAAHRPPLSSAHSSAALAPCCQ